MKRVVFLGLMLVLMLVFSGVVVFGDDVFDYVPSYVYQRQKVVGRGMSSFGDYDGHAEIVYEPRGVYFAFGKVDGGVEYVPSGTDISDRDDLYRTGYSLFAKEMVSRGYEGVLYYVPGYPALYFRLKIEGLLKYDVEVQLDDGSTVDDSGERGILWKHTILSLYHIGSKDKLYAVLRVRYFEAVHEYRVYLVWWREYLNESRMSYERVELENVSTSATVEHGKGLLIDFIMFPVFYEYDTENGTFLVFGFRGEFNVTCSDGTCAFDPGRFEFAWTSKNITNTTDLTELDIKEFVDDLAGWNVWVGAGLVYYEPGASEYEMVPDISDPEYPYAGTGVSDTFNKNITYVECTLFSYKLYVDILDSYAESWSVDPRTVYGLFIAGGLDKYAGAYMEITDNSSGYYWQRTVLLGLLVYVVAGMIGGFAWRIHRGLAGFVYLVILGTLGSLMGVWSYVEIIIIALVLAVGFMYKLYNER